MPVLGMKPGPWKIVVDVNNPKAKEIIEKAGEASRDSFSNEMHLTPLEGQTVLGRRRLRSLMSRR